VVKRNTLPQVIFSSFLISLGLLLSAGNIFAQEPQTAASAPNLISSTIDWETGILSITVEEFASRSSYNGRRRCSVPNKPSAGKSPSWFFEPSWTSRRIPTIDSLTWPGEERDLLRTLEENQ
jgi:hypothetical protein